MYSMGRRYGGEDRRQLKKFAKRKCYRRPNYSEPYDIRRKWRPHWLTGITGCLIFGKEGHLPNQRYNEEKIKHDMR